MVTGRQNHVVHLPDCFLDFGPGRAGNFADVCQRNPGLCTGIIINGVSPEEMKSSSGSIVVPRYPIRSRNRRGTVSSISSLPPNAILTGMPFLWKTPSMDILQRVITPTNPEALGVVIEDPVGVKEPAPGMMHFVECADVPGSRDFPWGRWRDCMPHPRSLLPDRTCCGTRAVQVSR